MQEIPASLRVAAHITSTCLHVVAEVSSTWSQQPFSPPQKSPPRLFLRVFLRTFSLYFWTAFLDFCVFVFVSPECPPLYYFAREH